MTRPRILLLLLLFALAACGRKPAPMPDLFPETVGAWHRTARRNPRRAAAPDGIDAKAGGSRTRGIVRRSGQAGSAGVPIDFPAVALDLVQRWHATADTVFFYQDRFFIVLKWQTADRKALQEFVAALEGKLKAKP